MRYTHICITNTLYTLLLYLLHTRDEDIQHTFFVLGDDVSDEICEVFPHHYHFSSQKIERWLRSLRRYRKIFQLFRLYHLKWLYYRFVKLFCLPRIRSDIEIYCIDHLDISPVIIGNHKYTIIEDSPCIFTNYLNGPLKEYDDQYSKAISRIERVLAGPVYCHAFGFNSQCTTIVCTKKDDVEYLKEKQWILLSLPQAWQQASLWKQKMVLNIFNLEDDDIKLLGSRSFIFFTQPLYKDVTDIAESDQINLIRRILTHYPPEKILIKAHPRDDIDYRHAFPECQLFKKNVPSQLMDMLGIRYERAITIFSTAVSQFSYPIKVDWYGTECDKRLLKAFGHFAPPSDVFLCSI